MTLRTQSTDILLLKWSVYVVGTTRNVDHFGGGTFWILSLQLKMRCSIMHYKLKRSNAFIVQLIYGFVFVALSPSHLLHFSLKEKL